MTINEAGIGYQRCENLGTATPSLISLCSKSVQVTFGGNQMSSFQNHLVKVIEFIEILEVEPMMLSSMSFHKKNIFFTNSFVKNVLKLTLNL